jgi:hypothetical protein
MSKVVKGAIRTGHNDEPTNKMRNQAYDKIEQVEMTV